MSQSNQQFRDICITEEDRREQWRRCVFFYLEGMKLLNQKEDLTDEEIAEFQRMADAYFNLWVRLNGREGVIN